MLPQGFDGIAVALELYDASIRLIDRCSYLKVVEIGFRVSESYDIIWMMLFGIQLSELGSILFPQSLYLLLDPFIISTLLFVGMIFLPFVLLLFSFVLRICSRLLIRLVLLLTSFFMIVHLL